uniref:Uncharacterized protein n=1 Tax=Salix viminalis TaxID=40686 RepID=A0A6N2MTD3_SALVM
MTNIEETYDHLLPVQTCGKGSSCRLSTRAGSFTIRTLPLNKPFSYCFSFDLLLKPLQFSLTTLPTCCPFTFFFAKLNPEPFKSGFFSVAMSCGCFGTSNWFKGNKNKNTSGQTNTQELLFA